jgi:hypothetical protein
MRTFVNSQNIRLVGTLLVLVAFYFIGVKIWANQLWLLEWQLTPLILFISILCMILYGISGFFLATAWGWLLIWSGQPDIELKHCYSIYGRTQIAKYIPGNIFHFAGRHLLGRQAGFGDFALIGASVYEIGGVILAAGVVGISGMIFFNFSEMSLSPLPVVLILFIVMSSIFIFSLVMPKMAKWRGIDLPTPNAKQVIIGLAPAYGLYLIFFGIIGSILALLIYTMTDLPIFANFGMIISVFSIAWISGFVTPGAPAGVGIREAILILLLTPLLGESQSLIVALIFRLISILGDTIFFVLSVYGFRRY